MFNNLLEDVAMHLEFDGFGRLPSEEEDGNIYYGKLPDQPDCAIGVLCRDASFSGSPQGARIQIIVRDVDTDLVFQKAVEITESLNEFDGFLCGYRTRANIQIENGPTGIGADAKKREMYSINLRIYYC